MVLLVERVKVLPVEAEIILPPTGAVFGLGMILPGAPLGGKSFKNEQREPEKLCGEDVVVSILFSIFLVRNLNVDPFPNLACLLLIGDVAIAPIAEVKGRSRLKDAVPLTL